MSEQGYLTARTENNEHPAKDIEEVDLSRNESSNMATGVINEPTSSNNPHARSSRLPPPNQRHSDDILDKLLESLHAVNKQNTGLPRLPKALATTKLTFDGKTKKFEHFEDLFQTSLKVHSRITEQEKIYYFYSLLRGDALQNFRKMRDATKSNLSDIIAGFCRRYVKTKSVATALCKWENLIFDPTSQIFPEFLELHQKLAQEAYADDAPKFVESSFLCKNDRPPEKSPQPSSPRNGSLRNNGPAPRKGNGAKRISQPRIHAIHGYPQCRTCAQAHETSTKDNRPMVWLRPPM